jgi:hypothetical protein
MKNHVLGARGALAFACALGAFALCAAQAHAGVGAVSLTGVVQGTWNTPVLTGDLIDGATGVPNAADNSATAACDIAGCPNGVPDSYGDDTLAWGINSSSSSININGHFFSDVPLNTPFDAAEITYFNGTSNTTTLIFGATMHLRFELPFGEVGPDVSDPIDIPLNIVTTINTGTDKQNADWIGPFGTVKPLTFNVYEGQSATAELWGEFVDDPHFAPTLIVSTSPNGFIGNGQPITVPEPQAWALALFGLGSLGLALRRRRSGQALGFSFR